MRLPCLTAAAALLAATAAGAASYRIDPTHSFVHAEIDHFGTSTIRLRIGPIDGDIEFDRDTRRGSVGLRIPTARVSSGVPQLDARLRERDLLGAGDNSEAFFVAERFSFDDRGALSEVRGEFTLRSVSRPLSLRALRFNCYTSPLFRREVCGGDFAAELKRSEFGADLGLPLVGDRVRLLITVEAIRQ